MLSDAPFVLLEDARASGAGPSRLYRDPSGIVEANRLEEIGPALERLRAALVAGRHVAGFLGYEAGAAFESRLGGTARSASDGEPPLLWFGLFDAPERLAPEEVAALLPDPAAGWASTPRARIDFAEYEKAFERVHDYIAAGDIYQANLSFRADVTVAGDPLALFGRMSKASRAGWGGIVHTGRHWLLSCSPELFFTLERGLLSARPMKGTARRGPSPASDAALAASLASSVKERAENLMIVDLLRNDLSRVARPGTVSVPALFTVETYPTLHTLTSTVSAKLAGEQDAIDVLGAIFPCGSVTGAPKIRAMEIIDEIERDPRGPYTGSLGWLDPAGNAAFNVLIRTLVLAKGRDHAEIGLGSAIVADSTATGEWRECLAKGAFVTQGAARFDLVETMRFDPEEGVLSLERHLARMKSSAEALGFAFDRHGVRNELQAATFRLRDARKLRLRLSPTGASAIEVRALPPAPDSTVAVKIVSLPVTSEDLRLRHKTSDRAFYDEARAAAGSFEVLFVDRNGFLTEGSFTNLFVERDGRLLTPPLARGLLPGVLRGQLIEEGRAIEQDLRPEDLAGEFLIGNALRGLIPARTA